MPATVTRHVFAFADPEAREAALLGGKGAGLAHLTRLGLPVPPGFVVTTRAGRAYLDEGALPAGAAAEIEAHLVALEARLDRRLGDPERPLLVSVRSGAPVSMPGMMDTVLNVGLTPATVAALERETGDGRFAWACYARFAEMYARVVRGVAPAELEDRLLGADGPREVVAALAAVAPIPEDPREQIAEAVAAVFASWNSRRAKAYRRFRHIDDDLATAATVQAMVFGNRGARSASGVAFTRDPSTGAPGAFGDVLFDAQGEDVVAGERDALPLGALAERLPSVHDRLADTLRVIETDAGDLCEVEFTIEEGELWILQTRVGLRSGRAAVRVAVALADVGRIAIEEALARVTPAQLEAAAAPGFAEEPGEEAVLARGLAASPGAATGLAVFDAARATELAEAGHDVVLLRPTTSPGDVAGFIAARGVVTGRGGRTSHAAVVARGMQRPAVCGIGEVTVAADRRSATLGGVVLHEGDLVSVDGDRGVLARGALALGAPAADPAVERLVAWAAGRAQVPSPALDGLDVVDTLEALAAREDRVVLDLRDAAALPPAALTAALEQRAGAPPVLRVAAAWLRRADAPVRGRVAGIVAPEDPPSATLLRAVLTGG